MNISQREFDALPAHMRAGAKISRSAGECLADVEQRPPKARRIGGRIEGSVPGAPIGKPRQTQSDKWKKRPCVMRYRAWADTCRECMGDMPEAKSVSQIVVKAFFEPPKSWTKKHRNELIGRPHHCKPDSDNVLKSVLDSLFKEDSAIADARVVKLWADHARTEIEITL